MKSKYLKYAIGEIVLVVVGILIALWISNWNEERKHDKIRKAFLVSLQRDLEADTAYLNTSIQQLQFESDQLAEFKRLVNENGTNKKTLIELIKSDMFPFITPFKGFNNNTYRAFANSGRLELIDIELQQTLFNLNSLQETIEKDAEKYVDLYFKGIEAFQLPLPINVQLLENEAITEAIWKNTDFETIVVRLNSWGTSKKNYYRIIISYLKQANALTQEILSKHFSKNH